MFEEDSDIKKVRSAGHKAKHQMFGLFVCTGMAHLVLTTFDVPGISYIRIFLVGAFYVALSISIKLGHERSVFLAIGAALFSSLSFLLEYIILGGNHLVTMLVIFDAMTLLLVLRYLRVRDDTLPGDVAADDLGLKYQQSQKAAQPADPSPKTSEPVVQS